MFHSDIQEYLASTPREDKSAFTGYHFYWPHVSMFRARLTMSNILQTTECKDSYKSYLLPFYKKKSRQDGMTKTARS